ncbi:MAG: cupin domain-containing protein [Patescibacteria group bacterium]|jgi:mannose-6-phosphate isomerase-like protein (cupin superfamily)
MRIVQKSQVQQHSNNENCVVFGYPSDDKEMNGAVAEITGRYPSQGRVTNLKCKEMGYVIKGSGKVVVEGVEVPLNEGDLVVIEPGEKYHWEGTLTVFLPCTPAWYPEQHRQVN